MFCDLYAHAQSTVILCCKFQIIIFTTKGEVAETQTQLCHVYKTNFQSKSRVHNSTINILIRSSVTFKYMLSLYAYCGASYKSLPWKLRSCRHMNSTIKCEGWTQGHMTEGKNICTLPLCGWGIEKIYTNLSSSEFTLRVVNPCPAE